MQDYETQTTDNTIIDDLGDSLWYCFAVATTVGFGDIAALSTIGRILTVILSLYSIGVVAILTAILTAFSWIWQKKGQETAPKNSLMTCSTCQTCQGKNFRIFPTE